MKKVYVVGDYKTDSGVTKFIQNAFWNNHDYEYVAVNISDSEDSNELLEKNGWEQVFIYPANQNIVKHWIGWFRLIKRQKKNIGLVYYNYSASWNVFPMIIQKIFGAGKIIVHAHNSDFGTPVKGLKKRALTFVNSVGRLVINKTCVVKLAASREAAKWVFGTENGVEVVNNGVDISRLRFNIDARRRVRIDHDVRDNTIIFGNVGVLEARKNQKQLIKEFAHYHKKNSNCLLWIFGEGQDHNTLEKLIHQLSISEAVKMFGKVDSMTEYYQAMDVFVLPSIHEGLSVAMVEALTAGLPCVISKDLPTGVLPTDRILKVNLTSSPNQWSEVFEKATQMRRIDYSEKISESGFDNDTLEKEVLRAIDCTLGGAL